MPVPPSHPTAFLKYQGTGNDFILLDWDSPSPPAPHVAVSLCDRRRGIGGDGLLLLCPPAHPAAAARMILYNPDGTRPEMCGNGLRCAAMHLASRHPPTALPFVIDTDAGPRTCEVLSQANPARIRVSMGLVSTPEDVVLDDYPLSVKYLSVGNPHAVLTAPHPTLDKQSLGPALCAHPRFPHGANIGFPSNIAADAFDLVVFERGAGFTLACGTGACAATVALASAGCLTTTSGVRVQLPGGILTIDFDPSTRQAWLTGETARVFHGTVPWPAPT